MTVILLIGGFQLLTISILGKYIGKIFMETKHPGRFMWLGERVNDFQTFSDFKTIFLNKSSA